jgi:16S rRNA processing protein RimM
VVRAARAYRDRLVLELEGVEDATSAARLRGARVFASIEDAPELPEGMHYRACLVGLRVLDERGGLIGVVRDVVPTGGTDVLAVTPVDSPSGEVLIPLAREIVLEIDADEARMTVRLPQGLLELNRPGS